MTFTSWLLPEVIGEAVALPARANRIETAIHAGDATSALLAAGQLISSLVITWVAFALVRDLLRTALRMRDRDRLRSLA